MTLDGGKCGYLIILFFFGSDDNEDCGSFLIETDTKTDSKFMLDFFGYTSA